MSRVSHPEYLAWTAWFDKQWEVFTKQDQYMASIACEVRRVLSKNPSSIKLPQFQLKFERGATVKMTREEKRKLSKSVWRSVVVGSKRKAPRGNRTGTHGGKASRG